ncbi:MAG: O-antigen ligase family protein [Acidobacteriaceae bacterium]
MVAWVTFLGASVFWSPDPLLTGRRLGLFFLLLLSAIAVASLPGDRIFRLLSVVSIVNLLAGVLCELYWGKFRPWQAGYRFGGAGHPNLQGTCLAVGLLAAIGFAACNPSNRSRAVWFGAICAVGLIATNSRTAMGAAAIACLIGAILVLLRRTRRRFRHHLVICILCGSAAMGLAATAVDLPHTLMHGMAEKRDDGNTDSLNGRVEVWSICLQYASRRMLLGYGYDSFWTANHIATISREAQWPINEAHSSYIDEILNEGLIGTILFSVLLTSCLVLSVRRYIRGETSYLGWALLFSFIIVHGVTESIMMPITSYPAYAIAVGVAGFAFWDRRTRFRLMAPETRRCFQ